jgi:hypothetical protein
MNQGDAMPTANPPAPSTAELQRQIVEIDAQIATLARDHETALDDLATGESTDLMAAATFAVQMDVKRRQRSAVQAQLIPARQRETLSAYEGACALAAAAARQEAETKAAYDMIADQFAAAQSAYFTARDQAYAAVRRITFEFQAELPTEDRRALAVELIEARRRAGLINETDYRNALASTERAEASAIELEHV